METLEIHVNPREPGSKHQARRLRREGKIPAILYGPKVQPISLELNKKEFSTRVAGLEGSHLVRLKSGSTTLSDKVALVKQMQYHPISGDVIHADFYEVDLTAKIEVSVPLHFVGKAAGVVRGFADLCAFLRSKASLRMGSPVVTMTRKGSTGRQWRLCQGGRLPSPGWFSLTRRSV